jgi:hypothetical protein
LSHISILPGVHTGGSSTKFRQGAVRRSAAKSAISTLQSQGEDPSLSSTRDQEKRELQEESGIGTGTKIVNAFRIAVALRAELVIVRR